MAVKSGIPVEAKRASELYLRCDNMYEKITETFERIESGEISHEDEKFKFFKIENDIKSLLSMLSRINTDILSRYISSKQIQIIEDNIIYMIENLQYIKKRILSDKYIKNLYIPVKKYLKNAFNPGWYKKWAKNEDELAIKFIGMLTHPDNIDDYIHQIKRISLGTMSIKEFKKIFEATKNKMIPRPQVKEQIETFESFNSYKERYEYFRII